MSTKTKSPADVLSVVAFVTIFLSFVHGLYVAIWGGLLVPLRNPQYSMSEFTTWDTLALRLPGFLFVLVVVYRWRMIIRDRQIYNVQGGGGRLLRDASKMIAFVNMCALVVSNIISIGVLAGQVDQIFSDEPFFIISLVVNVTAFAVLCLASNFCVIQLDDD